MRKTPKRMFPKGLRTIAKNTADQQSGEVSTTERRLISGKPVKDFWSGMLTKSFYDVMTGQIRTIKVKKEKLLE